MIIDIMDRRIEPTLTEMTNYIEGDSRKRWHKIINFIDKNFQSKSTIAYSKCSAKPGWNVKYKKSGRALCTLYPSKEYFTALIVLNHVDMEWFMGMRYNYSNYILNLYDNCSLFNSTKWLMIDITSDEILNDVENLMLLKLQ